jgi:uncharacterized membrane protein YgdD (TMEM256/DUF423 family)
MRIISMGALLGAIAVVLGAFGAHALRESLEPSLFEIYQTGSQYLTLHAFALVLYGLWHSAQPEAARPKCWPAALFLIGTIIFSGSLYLIAFTEIRKFGMITPVGGLSLIAGWLGFAYHAFQASKKS